MSQGGLSKSLIIISKAKGWDPNQIAGGENIENFNKAPDPWEPTGVKARGILPEGTSDSYPEDHKPSMGTDWEMPARNDGSMPEHSTKNADPFAGMGEF